MFLLSCLFQTKQTVRTSGNKHCSYQSCFPNSLPGYSRCYEMSTCYSESVLPYMLTFSNLYICVFHTFKIVYIIKLLVFIKNVLVTQCMSWKPVFFLICALIAEVIVREVSLP